jgi:glycosyltransferase involved in cell wall biosynthesis
MPVHKKKLLVFIPSIEDGGVEKNLFIILNYLAIKIKNVHLVTFDNSKKSYFNNKIKIINPIFNFQFLKGRYPKYILCLLLLIKILIFDRNYLVLSFQANIYVLIISKLFNLKVISRSNSSSAGWSQNPIKHFIFSFFFKKADKIIVNSVDFKKEMDKKYQIKSVCILNPFIFNQIKINSLVKIKKIYSKNVLKIISVGRLTLQKDFMTMLKAIKLVKKRRIQLIIIGKGVEKNNLLKFIKNNKLNNSVKLIGYKKNPFKYIKQSEIFLLTSIFEGSPNVLIEAQCLKKYIISTDCPTGPREILQNGKFGELVKMGDYKNIAKRLENFSYNAAVKKKVMLGFNNIKNYDHKKNCMKYYNLINEYLI